MRTGCADPTSPGTYETPIEPKAAFVMSSLPAKVDRLSKAMTNGASKAPYCEPFFRSRLRMRSMSSRSITRPPNGIYARMSGPASPRRSGGTGHALRPITQPRTRSLKVGASAPAAMSAFSCRHNLKATKSARHPSRMTGRTWTRLVDVPTLDELGCGARRPGHRSESSGNGDHGYNLLVVPIGAGGGQPAPESKSASKRSIRR
jgi:hypothetical protein